jgi:hypothetical protein
VSAVAAIQCTGVEAFSFPIMVSLSNHSTSFHRGYGEVIASRQGYGNPDASIRATAFRISYRTYAGCSEAIPGVWVDGERWVLLRAMGLA